MTKVLTWTETPLKQSFPQVRLSFAEKCLIFAEFCRELSARLRCTQLQPARSPLRRDCGRCGDLTFKTAGI